jgi:Fe-S-cluster containining protein
MGRTHHTMAGGRGASRTHCIRCGTCCLKGGPALHREDAPLFAKGILTRDQVYTLRRGEVIRDIDDALMVLEEEMLKIKGQAEGWTCIFYDDLTECRIYDHRPAECRALKCWDLKDIKAVMARPRLKRRDLLGPDHEILKIIDAHEKRCAYGTLESAVRGLEGPHPEGAVEAILDLLQYDHYMRPLIGEKLNIPASAMDFLFGRALTTTIGMFGLRVRQEDDSFILMPKGPETS